MDKVKVKKIKALEDTERYPVDSSPMSLPTLFVNSEQMPEIEGWEVGNSYQLVIEVEQKSKSEVDVTGKKKITDARFNIVGYKVIKDLGHEDDISEDEIAEGLKNK